MNWAAVEKAALVIAAPVAVAVIDYFLKTPAPLSRDTLYRAGGVALIALLTVVRGVITAKDGEKDAPTPPPDPPTVH